MSKWEQLSFQNAASPLMGGLSDFHFTLLILLTFILTLVLMGLFSIIYNSVLSNKVLDNHLIEIVWTLLPACTLIILALPSLHLLYLLDESPSPQMSVKSLGNQWYWTYEYSDVSSIEFPSYMLPSETLSEGSHRLLEVDNRLVLPTLTNIRNLVSAKDVIHSWALPSLGMKVDAIPGRLNQINLLIMKSGVFYGQCSEICGANHSFMPIVVEAIPPKIFSSWVSLSNSVNIAQSLLMALVF